MRDSIRAWFLGVGILPQMPLTFSPTFFFVSKMRAIVSQFITFNLKIHRLLS